MTLKKVAIQQSNYIPWKGYFDMINMADEFVIWDDVQYVKKSWRNRNKVKTKDGLKWLTIPVKVSGKFHQNINEVKIANRNWAKKHWRTLEVNYAKAPCFGEYSDLFESLYKEVEKFEYLTEINQLFLKTICELLEIDTPFLLSTEFSLTEGRNDRVIDLCQQLDADILINGPSAKEHMNEEAFAKAGIKVEYMDYSNYPEYPQLYEGFRHDVTILDLLFNTGPEARNFMKSFSKTGS